MKLIENTPLNTHIIAGLIRARDDLYLVWPLATHPFDHEQWRQALNPEVGNKSFLVYHGDDRIGHAALRVTANPRTYMVSFLFLLPEIRSKGYGTRLLDLLETYAKNQLSAEELVLVVRSYNPRAIKCYTKCGFAEYDRQGTLIRMRKRLV